MCRLLNKVAIVTGGAGGLGRAIVELFVAEGAKVIIADVDRDKGAAMAASLGKNTAFQFTDVSNAGDIQALINRAANDFGSLDVMVNNAAIAGAMHPRLLDEDFSDFTRILNVDLLGVMLGTQIAARYMAAHGGGSIINTSAVSGSVAGYGLPCYRVAKVGVVHFSKMAAIDFGEYGIRVNCISPGNISTEMNAFSPSDITNESARQWANALEKVRMAPQPLKRKGNPVDVAEAALFLAGDMSAHITGVVLPIDGGFTAGDPHVDRYTSTNAHLL